MQESSSRNWNSPPELLLNLESISDWVPLTSTSQPLNRFNLPISDELQKAGIQRSAEG